jgi:uncharacterized protein YbjT (DUF2867 family)
VIGAHGKVGRLLVPLLVEHGHAVSGIVRSEQQLPSLTDQGADGVLLDVATASEDALVEALGGHDAVVWTAGAGGGSPERTYAVDRDAAIRSMAAATAAGADRYVMVSWVGSRQDHGIPEDSAFFPYADAKLAADEHLRATDLAWTILGPGTLTDGPASGAISTGSDSADTSRANVALVVAAALGESGTVGRFIPFCDGDRLIAEALAELD